MKGKQLKVASFGLALFLFITPALAASSLRVEKITNEMNAPGLKFTCSYPHIAGITNTENQQIINVRFQEKASTAQKAAEYAAKGISQGATVEGKFDFEVKRNKGGVLSVVTTDELTQKGQTETKREGLNVNTVNGRTYKLGDLFFDKSDYIGVLSEQVKKQISQKGIANKMTRKFNKIRFNEEFYLTDNALVIVLEQGSYFPDDCGIQEFSIPLNTLDGKLEPSLRLST